MTSPKGFQVVWGLPDKVKPISNIPKGTKFKLRFRPHSHGKAFVRIKKETLAYDIENRNGEWLLWGPVGVNSWGET